MINLADGHNQTIQVFTGIKLSVRLNDRPRQVVRLLARGLTTKQVAMIMGIKVDTVHKHLRHAQQCMGADTRDQLMAMAGQLGLVDFKAN